MIIVKLPCVSSNIWRKWQMTLLSSLPSRPIASKLFENTKVKKYVNTKHKYIQLQNTKTTWRMQARCLGLGLGFAFVGVLPLRCSYQMSIPPLRMETGEILICPNLANHNSGIFGYLHPLRTNNKPFARMGEEYETTCVTSLDGKWWNPELPDLWDFCFYHRWCSCN